MQNANKFKKFVKVISMVLAGMALASSSSQAGTCGIAAASSFIGVGVGAYNVADFTGRVNVQLDDGRIVVFAAKGIVKNCVSRADAVDQVAAAVSNLLQQNYPDAIARSDVSVRLGGQRFDPDQVLNPACSYQVIITNTWFELRR